MVSIITPTFNSEAYIQETYDSIRRQTTQDWEWIIVDDGSTDSSIEMIKNYLASDSRIHFFTRDRLPKGATTCRNIGIEKSKGEYLVFFDSDDILASFCLKQRADEMIQNPSADFIVFQLMMFTKEITDTRILLNLPDDRDDLERAIRLNPVMGGSSSIWKKESIIRIGLWDSNILMNQDIELYIRAMSYGLQFLLRLDMPPDFFYRTNPNSISRAKKKTLEKQLSRVFYFSRVADHLKKNNLEVKYSKALQWLFLKLFFDFVYDKEPVAAKKIFNDNKEFVEKLPSHYKILCRLLLLSKTGGYYIVSTIRLLNKMILQAKGNKHITFGKEIYTGEVRI